MSTLLVFSLTLAESGRQHLLGAAMTCAGSAAADSISASYNRRLLEDYGLLFYDGGRGGSRVDRKGISEEFSRYFMMNAGTGTEGINFLRAVSAETEVTEIVTAADYRGEIMIRSALDFYRYDAAAALLQKITEQLGILGNGEQERENIYSLYERLKAGISEKNGSGGTVKEDGGIRTGDTVLTAVQAKRSVMPLADREETEDPGEDEPPGETEGPGDEDPFDYDRYEQTIRESAIGGKEEIAAGGWLKLVIPKGTKISGITVKREDLPSHYARDPREAPSGGILRDTARKVAFNEYLLDYFRSYTSHEDKYGVRYELEYLLFGHLSDEENLRTALNRLMWIREGLNLVHIAGDSEKMEKTESLAEELMGWTGEAAVVLVPLTQVGLIIAWAYAESLIDVRNLLSDGRVPLLKDRDSWNTGLESLVKVFQGKFTGEKEDEKGLSYRDYVRLLLFLKNPEDLSYRSMDLIQLNLQEENPEFMMQTQLYAMEFTVKSSTGQLFTEIPWLGERFGADPFKREERFTASY